MLPIMADTAPDKPKPKHGWLQFRLKTLFILVAVCAVPCWWFKGKWDAKQAERRAVAECRQKDVWLGYDWQFYTENKQQPPGPAFLRTLVGDDFFARLVWFQCPWAEIGNTDLMCLESLPDVETLILSGQTRLTDAGFEHIQGLSRLRCALLNHTKITGVGLGHLRRAKGLRVLNLCAAPEITNADLIQLTAFPDLEDLTLKQTTISSAGLEHLRGLSHLHTLDISNTKVTDDGLRHLTALKFLKHLKLFGTKTTKAGVADLAKALPDCDITGP
jgi:hypothetical protein